MLDKICIYYDSSILIYDKDGTAKAATVNIDTNNEQFTNPKTGQFYIGQTDLSLGANHFVELGVCGDESEDGCAGKPRSVYVKDIPSGRIPLLGNVSFGSITGCSSGLTDSRGLVPGMLEDLSEFAPGNFGLNLGGKGNFGGSKCKRISLPVGSHIYDPSMKCEYDYSLINKQNTLEGRQQEQRRQVYMNCDLPYSPSPSPELSKTWWYQEVCSPSYNDGVDMKDVLLNNIEEGESAVLPQPKPTFNESSTMEVPSSYKTQNSNNAEPFVDAASMHSSSMKKHSDPTKRKIMWLVICSLVVLLLVWLVCRLF